MSRIQSRRAAFRPLMSLGLVLIAVFLSGCEVLATEGARDAIAGQRVRALEDAELGPLEQEMNDVFVMEIQPREAKIEDLRYQLQVLEEEVLRPLSDAQNDAWALCGEASDAQLAFEGRYRELDLMQRSIDIDQRVWISSGKTCGGLVGPLIRSSSSSRTCASRSSANSTGPTGSATAQSKTYGTRSTN